MSEAETVTFLVERKIEDADGVPIREGSVLREIGGKRERGLVTRIVREGDRERPVFSGVGDLCIVNPASSYVTRCTNCYGEWRHIPRAEQTFKERLWAWGYREHGEFKLTEDMSEDEGRAISAILAVLPEEVVDWEDGPWADSLDEAMAFLVDHIDGMAAGKKTETRS